MSSRHTQGSHDLSLSALRQILVEADSAHSLEDQIERIVHLVRQAMGVDVCSLYQLDQGSRLRMVANVGLAEGVTEQIALDPGEGLVGEIANSKLPLNVPVAREHPAYRYFPGSSEEDFQAFLGAPITALGNLIGVIVVQDRDERGFTADEESFLTTIAAHLAGSMLRLPLIRASERSRGFERRIAGIKGAGGQARGRLRLVVGERTLNLLDPPEPQGAAAEIQYLVSAVALAKEGMRSAKERFNRVLPAESLELFDFYNELFGSDQLISVAQRHINEGASAFVALRASVDEHVALFEAIEDEYLRARAEDVKHVGRTLLLNLIGQAMPASDEANIVLVGDSVSVADIAQYERDQLAGIVCMGGSSYAHSTMLARALGVPAVIATGPIDRIKEGDEVVVDGDAGLVVLNPNQGTVEHYAALIAERAFRDRELLRLKDLPAVTKDGTRIALLANTGLLADVSPGMDRGAEGVGLYRSEIPFLSRDALPSEIEQESIYRDVLAAYAPLPVVMRTLDVGGDKQLPYLNVAEDNPALGWRGIRFSLDNRAIFVAQLRAMLRANAQTGNLSLMLPMIGSVDELREALATIDAVFEQARAEGIVIPRPPVGIMVEVPGIVSLLGRIAKSIDFISVGTNDLTQYLLAVDRSNPYVAKSFDFLHPGVLHTLNDIALQARKFGLRHSVCGEMAADPYGAVLLIGMGYATLSMNAFSLLRIKALIREISLEDCQRIASSALTVDEANGVRALVDRELLALGLEDQLRD